MSEAKAAKHPSAHLSPDAQAVVDKTIARWRARNVCPDPGLHADWNETSETVIRLKAEGRYMPAPVGWCDYCGKRLP